MTLDIKTVIFGFAISDVICMGVMAITWQQNRRRLSGLGFWLAAFVLHATALGLIMLRGAVPDVVSMTVSNTLIVASAVVLYEGLGRFVQQRVAQTHNLVMLAAFAASYAYFALARPSLMARSLILSAGLLVICSQCAWLMLRRARQSVPPAAAWLGLVFAGYSLVSLIRIILVILAPPGDEFFSESHLYDALALIIYQMFVIALTLSLMMLVNRRWLLEFQAQGESLRASEEKFAQAFHATPDAIVIVRAGDGRIVEVNEGFCRLTGYTRAEAVGHSILDLRLWADPQQGAEYIAVVQAQRSVRDYEYDFIAKSGARLICLCASETIELEGEPHILTVARDITGQRLMQAQLAQQQQVAAAQAERERLARELHDNLSQVLAFMNVQAQAAHDFLAAGNSAQAGAHMLRLAEAARETHSDMRQFIADSLMTISPQAGLAPVLRQSLEQFERMYGIHTELELAEGEWALDPASQAQLLRIIQEALSNVRKHARARKVRVSLTADESHLCALITDDGVGFSMQAAPGGGGHFGLGIMQDRAAEIGGTVEISSVSGQGTQVRVRVPFKR